MIFILFIFGGILTCWGIYRMRTDFSENKKKNNIVSLLLQGEASGIGQLLGGIICIILGIIAFIIK
ncbi:hypothetical protein LIT25_11170 [Bacillus sp. F19]|nr:hypothetical protein LIT25_11170 [Bacillus sp. F19]